MQQQWISATYQVPWQEHLLDRAQQIAVGMTVGSWNDLPAVRQTHLRKFLGEAGPVTQHGQHGHFVVRYPVDNFAPSMASLLTVIFGKLSLDGPIRLVELELPPAFVEQFGGPAYGIAGLRRTLNVLHRPLVMSIFKSENGRSLPEFLVAFDEQISGGVDLVKDDEIYFYDKDAPLIERAAHTREALDTREARTGQKGFYAANLAATPSSLLETAWTAFEAGVQAFLVSPYAMGLDTLVDLRRHGPPAVLIAHPAFAGGLVAPHRYGLAPHILFGQLARLAGADMVLYPSPYGSVAMDSHDALAVAQALTQPAAYAGAWPGPSAGVHAEMLPRLHQDFGTDLVINAGGAIHGHPQGTRAGAAHLVEAMHREWEGGGS